MAFVKKERVKEEKDNVRKREDREGRARARKFKLELGAE